MGSKVPKFGAWEGAQGAENFTVYFDSARKTKNNGQKINPNDPEENPDLFPQYAGSSQAQPKPEPSPARVAEPRPQPQGRAKTQAPVRPVNPAPQGGRAKVPQFGAWNGGEGTQYTAYFESARKTKNDGGEPAMNRDVSDKGRVPPATKEPAMNRDVNDKVRAPPVAKVRTELPKEDVSRNVSRGSTSSMPSSDSLGKQPSAPKPTAQPKANPQPRHQAAAGVPQFGAWNNNGPSQPEGYTVAFARAKEDRKTPLHASAAPSYNQPPQNNNQKQASCCSIL